MKVCKYQPKNLYGTC